LFLSKDGLEVVRVDCGVASIPSFRIDVPLSSESIQFSAEMTRAEPNDKIELKEVLRPLCGQGAEPCIKFTQENLIRSSVHDCLPFILTILVCATTFLAYSKDYMPTSSLACCHDIILLDLSMCSMTL